MKSLGICIGAASISIVGLEKNGETITPIILQSIFHNGDPKKSLLGILDKICYTDYEKICVTGRKFRKLVNFTSISEPEAVETAIPVLITDVQKYNLLVSAGAETTIIYELDGKGYIINVFSGNKCASGTGSFFIQQLGRMGLTLSDLKDTYPEDKSHAVAGRCSVFCKTDCTHALNAGVEKERIVCGLCKMMGAKITELLSSMDKKNIILTGGISKIKPIVEVIKKSVDLIFIPEESVCFEAYGAALWAFNNETKQISKQKNIIRADKKIFDFLKPLADNEALVEFKTMNFSQAQVNDECILGIDIGSTTTKAVLLRKNDCALVSHVYLKTNGDPIAAAKKCYLSILDQLNNVSIKIIGIAATGSGRQIVAFHALTDSIYNEIVCHANASVYFDKDVDTIFEIGGQDAKYTYLTGGVPSDTAMNEACSAGTGSFLEEASIESLGLIANQISELAIKADKPLNFNDQCAAFILSDIRTALQDDNTIENIVAGLIYSVCINYNNRVRGARPYGKKIFMQGGVCYNKAVPLAMASLLNTKIIIPPEPGLMGAFGAALEAKNRIEKKILEEKIFDLNILAKREINYLKPFICSGEKQSCDRKCEINMFNVDGKKMPYGGACNKYYNLRHNISSNTDDYNLFALREEMLFNEFASDTSKVSHNAKMIGINRSFLTHMLYPLYFNFWSQLGFKIVLSDEVTQCGIQKCKTSFCYPAQIAHGAFDNLLSKNCDAIFMPHILHIPVTGSNENNKVCIFVQGEPYYLKEAFKDKTIPPLLAPVIDFQAHVNSTKKEFIKCASIMGVAKKKAQNAFDYANNKMDVYFAKAQSIGKNVISELENDKNAFALVIQGRWYNALAKESNLSIPKKIASRNIRVIPFDFIPFEYKDLGLHMHWGIGKITLQVAKFVKSHLQLFSVYVTNFSCGPDSYLVSHFRDEMGTKPSLTIETDGHTADIGIDTRIEAAIDIIRQYMKLKQKNNTIISDFKLSTTFHKGNSIYMNDSQGKIFDVKKAKASFLFPMMGRFLTEGGIAALKRDGFNAKVASFPGPVSLGLGKANSSCKECLTYIFCIGSLLEYIKTEKKENEKVVYFIIGDPSPCRTEQFQVGFKKFIEKNKIKDVAIYTLESSDAFAGIGLKTLLSVWNAFCAADVLEQIYSAVLALAVDLKEALRIFETEWEKLRDNLEGKNKISFIKQIKNCVIELNKIKMKHSIQTADRITITGEMYVRNEPYVRQNIEKTLAEAGFISRISPIIDWHYYIDYILWKNISKEKNNIFKRLFILLKNKQAVLLERKIKKIFAKCKFYEYETLDIKKILKTSETLVSNQLIGDIGITIGTGLSNILKDSCGIITLGPFACLQTRMAEAILNCNMTFFDKLAVSKESVFDKNSIHLQPDFHLPYLAIESDGNPYPQLIEARLEVFLLQAKRIGKIMRSVKSKKGII